MSERTLFRHPTGTVARTVHVNDAPDPNDPLPYVTPVNCRRGAPGHHTYYLLALHSWKKPSSTWTLTGRDEQHLYARSPEDGTEVTWRVHDTTFADVAFASPDAGERQVLLHGEVARLGRFVFHPWTPNHVEPWQDCVPQDA
ncbi:MAG: hypothetical protein NVV70_03730 [Cellulomonas sp.]|nr:hypothetical protein [Cellulomonas sp.]MCR6647278.1 hypothetical protein [Cellulomonas sp.]